MMCLAGLLAAGALLSASASAAVWWVDGNPLTNKGNETEEFESATPVSTNPKFSSANLVIECTEIRGGLGNYIIRQFEGAGRFEFKTCSVVGAESGNCEVVNKEFETSATQPFALLDPIHLEILPLNGSEFASFKIQKVTGRTCGLPGGEGEYKLKGAVVGSILLAGAESREHYLKFLKESPSKLKLKPPAGAEEGVEFEAEFRLKSKTLPWSTRC